ncbi:MAG TPA: ABC transporter permease [Bryobacterales bacterium]|nr:ABC transporter permease [Bryobacterales bacterium]
MRQIRSFLLRLGGLFQHSRREQDLTDEFESNIGFHVEDNLRAGMAPEEARRQAILRFGGIESTKQDCRDRLGLPFLETFLYDLRYAARSLARSRMFTVVAVATLAFGIGATTTMFTVAQAVLLRPLPYAQPGRLVAIAEVDRLKPSTGAGADVASADFAEWQRMDTVFSGMAAYVGIDERGKVRIDLPLTGIGETRILKGLVVHSNLFDVLGVAPVLGRNFAGEDRVAILSYKCWRTQFAADPHIVGRSITLGGVPRDVIGVMPRGFFFPNNEVEVFIPPGDFTPDRVFHDEGVIARLRPGASLQQARAQMAMIGARLQQAYPKTNATLDTRVEIFHSALAATSRAALLMLFSAVGILFVIVCSNVAHLQLGRAASRRQEFTIRKALGAGRGRLIRQLFTESLLLSGLGGLLGLVLANAARAVLLRFAPEAIPSYADLRIDTWVILFNLGVTLLAPLLFGIGPALSAARPDSLRDRGESSPYSDRRARGLLVSAEVALSVVLVVCAGLLIRSFVRLEDVDLGFRTGHTLSFRLDLGDFVPSEEQRARQYAEIESRLLEQPGIEATGATARPVLGGGSGGEAPDVTIQGRERSLRLELVTPGYFLAMRTPLLRGRFPNQSDTKKSGLIAVVNSAFESAYFPDKNTVGKQVILGRRGAATIVGVVADLKQERIDRPARPAAFIPSTQIIPPAVTFFVRGRGDRHALVTAARRAVHSVNKVVPLANVATLDELVQASISGQRVRTTLLSLVAGAALFLAALGLYGVLAYSVVQRSTEIGIRMALGASAPRLFRMILLDGMRPVIIGAAFGFAAAYAASGLIRSLLFGTVPADPATYLLTVLILAVVSLCACAIPAMNAIHVDPMVSLRRQ